MTGEPENEGPRKRSKPAGARPSTSTDAPRSQNSGSKRPNTAVYVSGLPADTTQDELESQFSKYGVLAENLTTGEKRIKLYYEEDKDGKKVFTGNALVVYFKSESVPLAIALMDGAAFPDHTSKHQITVEPAKFSQSSGNNDEKQEQESNAINKTRLSERERAKIKQRAQKLNDKLGDWSEDEQMENENLSAKHLAKSVVINHAFSLAELNESEEASDEIEQDLKEGCEEIGPVKTVTLFKGEPTGVALVKFRDESDAQECVARMSGRYFGGRRLEAWIHDGSTYRRS